MVLKKNTYTAAMALDFTVPQPAHIVQERVVSKKNFSSTTAIALDVTVPQSVIGVHLEFHKP